MSRRRHPDFDIEKALTYVESNGWRVEPAGPRGHAWGKMLCPHNDPECRCGEFCITSNWSTSRDSHNHARQIRRVVDGCSGRALGDECDE
jgi:hypothetical protein